MEDRYGTFKRELGPSRPEPPPLKPLRQIRRPEHQISIFNRTPLHFYNINHNQYPGLGPGSSASLHLVTPLRKSSSIKDLTQTETPWESVTLNRCLFVAIAILVITSGFQKLHGKYSAWASNDTRGGVWTFKTFGSFETQSGTIRDLTDDNDEEGSKTNRGRSKRREADRISRGLRNRPLLEKLMKPRENKLMDRRRKKTRDDSEEVDAKKKLTEKNGSLEETEDNVNEEEKKDETSINGKSQMKKEKTKVHKV
ncbi:hypothetical protein N1851_025370 [Merluccius polli]|uniref:Uncharacterized protein n=1 Tax=Merluccius polli TaxID=89951 RepID=A0AA47MDM7_MERPO|nr:hypothetical protein N1851_025370 [Merluccius polli]